MYPRRTAGKRQKISAGGWNAAMRGAEAQDEELRTWRVPAAEIPTVNCVTARVVNRSGARRLRGEVLGVSDWLVDPDDQAAELYQVICLKGIIPTTESHADRFVIVKDSLEEAEVGEAILTGLALLKIDVLSADHKFATITNNDPTRLTSASSGRARIIKAQEGIGLKLAVVELGQSSSPKVFCVTNEIIDHGQSGEVERIRRNAGNTAWERSGETFTAHDIFLNTGESVEECFIVSVVPYEGLQVIDSIYCLASDWLGGCP